MPKLLSECVKIFLDTSVIVNLFKTEVNADSSVLSSKKIIKFLLDNPAKIPNGKNKLVDTPRTFYYSAVSLSEIILIDSDEEKTRKMAQALAGVDIELVSFSKDVALRHNQLFKNYVNKPFLNDYARTHKLFVNDLKFGREWISRDFMIMATADFVGADVLLTADKADFKPLADKIGVFCQLTDLSEYNVSPDEKDIKFRFENTLFDY